MHHVIHGLSPLPDAYSVATVAAMQWAHFAAWPVLGTGIILACMPSHDQMADKLRASGLADERQQEAASGAAANQLAAIRKVAGDSRPFKPSI